MQTYDIFWTVWLETLQFYRFNFDANCPKTSCCLRTSSCIMHMISHRYYIILILCMRSTLQNKAACKQHANLWYFLTVKMDYTLKTSQRWIKMIPRKAWPSSPRSTARCVWLMTHNWEGKQTVWERINHCT